MSDAPAAPAIETGVPPVVQDNVEEDPGFKVFVGNLAYSTTEEGLKTFFAPVESDVLSTQIIKRGTKSAGYGFVAMKSAEATQRAVQALDKKELDGRQIIIEVAKPADQKEKDKKEKRAKRRPGRRGSKAVPGEVSEAEANGQVDKAQDPSATDAPSKPKKKKKSKKPKRAATENADAAVTPTGEGVTTDEAKKPRPRKKNPRPPRPVGEDPTGEPSKTMLFVANLGFNIDDAGLTNLFSEAGINVVSARIVRRRWGRPRRSKGYGFVEVDSEEEQKKAIEALQGKEVGGRALAVKIAVNTAHEDDEDDDISPAEDAPKATPAPAAPTAAAATPTPPAAAAA